MNNDIIYSILLYSDLSTLRIGKYVNKYIYNLLYQRYFWINKFSTNNLILYKEPNCLKGWYNEYRKSSYSQQLIYKLLYNTIPKHSHYYHLNDTIILNCDYAQTLFIINYLIVTQEFDQIDGLCDTIVYFNINNRRPNINIIMYYGFNNDDITLCYTREEIIDILKLIFYTYPNITIKNVLGQTIKL